MEAQNPESHAAGAQAAADVGTIACPGEGACGQYECDCEGSGRILAPHLQEALDIVAGPRPETEADRLTREVQEVRSRLEEHLKKVIRSYYVTDGSDDEEVE